MGQKGMVKKTLFEGEKKGAPSLLVWLRNASFRPNSLRVGEEGQAKTLQNRSLRSLTLYSRGRETTEQSAPLFLFALQLDCQNKTKVGNKK